MCYHEFDEDACEYSDINMNLIICLFQELISVRRYYQRTSSFRT